MAAGQPAVQYLFDHRHLIVDDVPKTVAFYEGVLGAKKVQELEFRGVPIVLMDLQGTAVNVSGQIHAGGWCLSIGGKAVSISNSTH